MRAALPSVDDRPTQALTGFAGAEAKLAERCGSAPLDGAAFRRKLARCSLGRCRGTCCYDGVHVDEESAAILQALAADRAEDFARMGLSLPDDVIVQQQWRGSAPQTKTAVKPFPFSSVVEDYPAHFNDTACVFLLEDAHCALQVLAQADGKHPWHYKPFGCWLHPISVSPAGITLPDDASDPYRLPGYDGFASKTFCGRTCDAGEAAADVLQVELEFLGRLLHRDLFAELSQSPGHRGGGPPSDQSG
jgi:hypothetical protein